MAVTLKCPRCGHLNSLGRMFCTQCGEKLEVNASSVKSGTTGEVVRSTIGRIVRWVVGLLILVCIIQIIRPVRPGGAEGGPQDAQRMAQKIRILSGAAHDGRAANLELEEAQINAYLEAARNRNKDPKKGGLLQLEKVNIDLLPNRVLTTAMTKLGPITLTYEVESTLVVKDRLMDCRIKRVRLGRMPMPPPLSGMLARKVSAIFREMDQERRLLQQLDEFTVAQDKAVAKLTGRTGAGKL
jgi:hypothetical protein